MKAAAPARSRSAPFTPVRRPVSSIVARLRLPPSPKPLHRRTKVIYVECDRPSVCDSLASPARRYAMHLFDVCYRGADAVVLIFAERELIH